MIKFYADLLKGLDFQLTKDTDLIAGLANASAYLFEHLPDINWAGFYLMRGGELVLGPFQGKTARVRIPLNEGVCGAAATARAIVRVHDVHEFPGHIACDPISNSEIVLPIFDNDGLFAVLDIDSPTVGRFTADDEDGLAVFANMISDFVMRS
ncbi:MAG: GAF domain-containing protein [Defluviitaleaceae bacterium]|nr:GAF domain-containing protein [Defluviitaleaceae bacterium]